MENYDCNLCNYKTNLRANYLRHIKSKKHKINNGELSGVVVFGCPQNGEMNTNEHNYNTNEHKYSTNEHKYSTNEQKYSINSRSLYYCGYCGNDFATQPSMMRHEKNYCKILKNEEKEEMDEKDRKERKEREEKERQDRKEREEKERQDRKEKEERDRQDEKERKKKEALEILELKLVVKEQTKQISKLIKKVGNTTNNTNNSNNTTNNNIILNSYGKEDLSHITNILKTLLIKGPFMMIPKLIEEIHFNKEKPENKNICYPNKKNNIVKVYKNDEWKYFNKEELMEGLMADSYYILDVHYDENGDNVLNDVQKKRYRKFKKQYDNGELDKGTKGEINLILINGD
jgi:hypothetical protein